MDALQQQARRVALGVSVAVAGAAALELKRRVSAGGGLRALVPDADLVRHTTARMTTPLLPDDYLHLVNPLWSARELRGRIDKVIPEAGDAATLVIRPGWGWSFDYQPGQFVGIGVDVDGSWHWRSYSLSSAPKKRQGHIAITVKAMPEGFLSQHLVSGLEPGTIVRLALPAGEFVLPDPPPERLLFLTAGSGITPIMSMLRTLDRRGTLQDVTLVHSAPDEGSVIFGAELRELAGRHEGLRLHQQLTDTAGHFQLEQLEDVCPDWRRRDTWACGPGGLLDSAERHWKRAGAAERLHLERFTIKLGGSAEGGHVVFRSSGREADSDGATTLLEAAEGAGAHPPFGCRMGICHTCVVPLVSGKVRDLRSGKEYVGGERIQTCVTAAAGDCVVDA